MASNESLTFANYNVAQLSPASLYEVGKTGEHPTGVVPEMAVAFGHELEKVPTVDNLGMLISKVGPAKELQNNVQAVRRALGTDKEGVEIARGWVERSGILVPVERSYMTGERALTENAHLMVATDGVRNWMQRRAASMKQLHEKHPALTEALLITGNRPMKVSEGPDIKEGMTAADYMRDVVAQDLAKIGIATTVVEVPSGVGDEVMREGALKVKERLAGEQSPQVVLVSNAGAWPQNGGQFRRALREKDALGSSFDQAGNQLVVVADGFELGQTGSEPTATHQNPFSALGQIVRDAQEFVRQR